MKHDHSGEVCEQLTLLSSRLVDFYSEEELGKKLHAAHSERRPLRIKYGADPSAPDIHLGHVVGLKKLREFQNLGHTVVFIIGDFTAMIGDPSGRSKTRPALNKEDVERNAKTYQEQVYKVLDPKHTEIRFNSEWFAGMAFGEVIKLSSFVTVAQMLQRDDFAKRYAENAPISLVEFLYPLIQAYDSVMVNADVELGGTDQLFNLLLGRELQKSFGKDAQVVMTLPLLEGLDGVRKMSKSLDNYVGISETPGEMFGKLMSLSDDLMWRYFELALCKTKEDIEALRASDRNPRHIKDEMAQEIIAEFHDPRAARTASEEFSNVFAKKKLPADIPKIIIPVSEREDGKMGLLTLLVKAGLASSNSDARRLAQQGAVTVGDKKITDAKALLEIPEGAIIKAGKRRFAKIFSA